MDFSYKYITGDCLSSAELYTILMLRSEVFVVEQNCVYQDIDGEDLSQLTTHVICYSQDKKVAAYSRILYQHTSETGLAKIGRVIVQKKFRGLRLGSSLLQHSIDQIKQEKSANTITGMKLSAQSHLAKFYGALGFTSVGDVYDEDGIPHIDMISDLS
ncbi:GCN5-related N-acetyltransferase [Nadsonia fulvescens var. elongata DSM 6958]|uniref:GCN5-related N-acetyltransferase n=1 Tax=Nadsonia fulvescens var. elongata DSM 6958 TaxID=857566 RepID=A0A1E3PHK8_9ASCO|nr:GCN5-related N-acetyltransferase [Nadsonia fulvescens var. elongata DSM 6958]